MLSRHIYYKIDYKKCSIVSAELLHSYSSSIRFIYCVNYSRNPTKLSSRRKKKNTHLSGTLCHLAAANVCWYVCVCTRVLIHLPPNVQAYGNPGAAYMQLCPETLSCVRLAPVGQGVTAPPASSITALLFNLTITLFMKDKRLFLKCAREMGEIIPPQISLRSSNFIPRICWRPDGV